MVPDLCPHCRPSHPPPAPPPAPPPHPYLESIRANHLVKYLLIEQELDRREGKGRACCLGGILECRTSHLAVGMILRKVLGRTSIFWGEGGVDEHPFFHSIHSAKYLLFYTSFSLNHPGIQFRPPTSSDDLCLPFCLILTLRAECCNDKGYPQEEGWREKVRQRSLLGLEGRICSILCSDSRFASVGLEETVEFILFFQIHLGKTASAARN